MTKLKQIAIFVLAIFALPFVAWLFTWAAAEGTEAGIAALPEAATVSTGTGSTAVTRQLVCGAFQHSEKIRDECFIYDASTLVSDIALASMVMALVLVVVIWITARRTRRRPVLLAILFGLELRILGLFLCVLTLVQGFTAIAVAAFLLSLGKNNPPLALLGVVFLATITSAFLTVRAALHITRRGRIGVLAEPLTREGQPRIWQVVDRLCAELQAEPPKQIIAGISTVFFVTVSDVTLTKEGATLSGETMHLSFPLLRLLSTDELTAVIAHELGHFAGKDLIYAKRFVPIYSGMDAAIRSLRRGPIGGVVLYPASLFYAFFFKQFQDTERDFSRSREHAADAAAARVGGGDALVRALLKLRSAEEVWIETMGDFAEGALGTVDANALGNIFEKECRDRLPADDKVEAWVSGMLGTHQGHPTDTHPTLRERAAALGVDPVVAARAILVSGEPSISLLDNPQRLEQELFEPVVRQASARRAADLPAEPVASDAVA